MAIGTGQEATKEMIVPGRFLSVAAQLDRPDAVELADSDQRLMDALEGFARAPVARESAVERV